MPVSQRTAEIDWPQNGQIGSVSAPLIGYTPVDLDVSIPCTAVNALPPGGSVLLSTTPKQAPKSGERGLFIRKTGAADARAQFYTRHSWPLDLH